MIRTSLITLRSKFWRHTRNRSQGWWKRAPTSPATEGSCWTPRTSGTKPSSSERQHKLSREEQSQYEEEVEVKEANPWVEGQEAGPRASEEFFKNQACLMFFFLVLKSVRLMDNDSFTSRSDQDSLKSKQFSNKFIIIQTSQPMNRNRTRQAGIWLYNFPRAGNTDKLSSLYSSQLPWPIHHTRSLTIAN